MSLGLANASALGGLRMTALGTRLVAENLANSDVEGYGVRRLVPTNLLVNGQDRPVQRAVNPVLLEATRSADAARVHAETRLTGTAELERALGLPGEAGSLNSRVTAFAASLRQAVSMPDSEAALQSVAQDAAQLATMFNSAERSIQSLRQTADGAAAKDVDRLNGALDRVVSLNREIQRQSLLGGTIHGLMDERQRVTSDIARIIPVTEIPRDDGRVMLLAANGQVLADLTRAEFGFTPGNGIAAEDTLANGRLSPITLEGRALSADSAILASGKLGANLAMRDEIAPDAQNRLDALAHDLLDRFSGPTGDASLGPGVLGLFTLDGASTLPAATTGLAGRMQLSTQISPQTGEGLWRLRSGLAASAPGPTLDPANLANMQTALEAATSLRSGAPARAYDEHVATQVSALATNRLSDEGSLAYATAEHAALQEDLAAQGVDTDRQMQDLLRLERAYAANARVLSTLDRMMRDLLEI